MNKALDPDLLAAREHEQAFLLTSLDDLDAEFEAGDLSPDDYAALSDDYTRRVAEVIRSIDEQRAALVAQDNRLSTLQRVLTVVGMAAVAIVAGVLLARASGFRTPTDTITGDIRQSSSGLLAEADTLTREGRWPEAIDVYDQVLDLTPANVEALTYRGWLKSRLGDAESGLLDLDQAVAIDPEYPDARVFSAILLDDAQRFDDAAAQLAALDALEVSTVIAGLVEASDIRASVAAGQIAQRFGDGQAVDLGEIDAALDDVARAGLLLDSLDPVLAIRVFDAVLAADPDQLLALVGKGRRLGADSDIFADSPDIAGEGLALLDRAVMLAPESAEVRLYRALARRVQGDPEGAAQDLDLIDPELLPDELVDLYELVDAGLG